MGLPNPVSTRRAALFASLTTCALIITSLVAVSPAAADTAPPPIPGEPETVSSDALPTPQINGVVWDQEIVGNTVYVAGEFTRARPAGAAAGTNEVVRTHLLSYSLTSGQLLSWAPSINAQVRQLAVSPDQSRIYAVGDFTTVNGAPKTRIVAFNTANGAVIDSFAPTSNNRIYAVAATNTTVYIGGAFSSVTGTTRIGAAAVSAANGTPTAWQPSPSGGRIYAMAISPDRSKVVLGGDFTTLNGSSNPGYGLGAVDAATGASLAWNSNSVVRNGGVNAAVFSLDSDATSVYGTGYVFGSGGNLEGAFRADWASGDLVWVEDCHGDHYSISVTDTVVYTAGHAHYCGNIGGFPQTEPDWTLHRAIAFTKDARGVISKDPHGYHNFAGNVTPSLLNWFPDINLGSYTGQYQGPWSVDTAGDYVVYGGEFTRVNGKAQQGLVRFASKTIAPNLDGPRLTGDDLMPTLTSSAPGTMTLAWTGDWDRDNEELTYFVYRDGKTATPVYTTTVNSRFWDLPTMSWIDTGLTPGQSYSYRIRAVDAFGNSGWGTTVSATVATSGTLSDYARAVIADQPTNYWRLGDSSGTTARDSVSRYAASKKSGVTLGASGAIIGDSDTAAQFNGNSNGYMASSGQVWSDNTFSVEAWFSTTTNSGGKIVGFGSRNDANSNNYDRHVYMNSAGNLLFGVYPGSSKIVQSAKKYNDGEWHHVVATLGEGGMQLFVDGVRVGYNPAVASGQGYWGYWRIGGDNSWSGDPFIKGTIDEVAIYPNVISQAQVLNHYALSGREASVPAPPTDAYGAAVYAASPSLFYRLGDGTGTVAKDSGPQGANGSYAGDYTLGEVGAVKGTSDTAAAFSSGSVASVTAYNNPSSYSTEIWFSTESSEGGKLTGFGSAQSGLSSSYDRHVYMRDDGTLTFGVWTGTENTITSTGAFNDGQWHHVVATQSPSTGMRLYVDGTLIGSNPQTGAQDYSGYWRAGGDTTWAGATSAYLDGSLDEFAVYPFALTASDVLGHYELGAPEAPGVAPSAAFTPSATGLSLTVDASASTDSDGTIASYSWDFGDGTATVEGTTPTATHDYAAAGSYTVTLVVTDDDGDSDTVTTAVEVVKITVAPTASFTQQATALTASFDASGSDDPDGTIVDWAWAFSDGGTASGETASHSFGAEGSYTVTLTVTDNDGLSATSSDTIVVTTAPTALTLAEDHFARTASGGWGAAETGGAWSVNRASDSSVSGGVARQSHAAGATRIATLGTVSTSDADIVTKVSWDKTLTGGGGYAGIIARHTGSDYYQARVRFYANGDLGLQILQGGSTILAHSSISGSYTAGSQLNIRVKIEGTSPTSISAKAWAVGETEPSEWQLTATSSVAALQQAGAIGLVSYLSGSATGTPFVLSYDDFVATNGVQPAGGEPDPVDPDPVDPDPVDPDPVDPDPVDPAAPIASDDFARTATNGWGSAATGGAWTSKVSSGYAVDNDSGAFIHSAGSTRHASLNDISATDVTLQAVITSDKDASVGQIVAGLVARQVGTDFYQGRMRLQPGGQVSLQIMRGSSTLLANLELPELSYAAGDRMLLKVLVTGTSPTTISAKLWKEGTTEPTEWQLTASDSTAALQVAASIGVESYVSGSADNAPITVRYDDFVARIPE